VEDGSVESRFEDPEIDCCWIWEVDGIRDEGGGVDDEVK
jgi:hypothetical protein